jgi:hypothetical protein
LVGPVEKLEAEFRFCSKILSGASKLARRNRRRKAKPLRQSKRPAERRRLVRDEQTPNKRDGVTRRDKSESKGSDRRSHKEETERATKKTEGVTKRR